MARFTRHAVCSPLTAASAIGLEVLRDGGNAVDAAVATNLALAVGYPHMCGVGGDLLAMVWADGALVGLNSSGRLPAAATLPPDGVPERGIGSATVPGAPAGWAALVERFGTRSLGELCVVDGRGMAVSLNQSLYMAFGSGVVVPGTGVLLHNRGAYHTHESYRGGARPVHTLAPGMTLAGGKPRLVFGTMGGEAQVQIHLQLLARILVAGASVEDAIAAPRWVLGPGLVLAEKGLELPDVVGGLPVQPMPAPELAGHAHAIAVEQDGLRAACDPRADGVPVGD